MEENDPDMHIHSSILDEEQDPAKTKGRERMKFKGKAENGNENLKIIQLPFIIDSDSNLLQTGDKIRIRHPDGG